MENLNKSQSSILIVDDNPKNLEVLGKLLQVEKYKIEFAINGNAALEWLDLRQFDLILLDINMPGLNGFEVCKKIRSNPQLDNTPVIFLSAENERESILKGFELGAQDYVTKPFDSRELIMRVKTHLLLKKSIEELEGLNTSLEEKVKERTLQLNEAKERAEASDRLKTAFMNNISHEIRTPLNGILGFGTLIVESDITMEEKEEYLEILNFSSDRLMNTIDEIMDISLIMSGNMKVHPQPIDISLLLTKVFEDFQKPCMKKNLDLKMKFPDNAENFILNTDGEILQKAVSKLVENSVKFTKEGSITLGFELINNEIEIFVKDTGQGIEKDSQELIYKIFMQENVSSTRGYEGIGLGLSISKGIMQLLGGEIRLESTKNKGTTVFLSLPNISSTVSSKPKNSTNAIKVGEKPLLLIAEDDDSSYALAEILLRKDNNILRAYNGQEAVDLCRKHPDITLVLMDIKMPVMNGIEATHLIKSFRNDLPIIAVTAHAQNGDEFKIKEAGCDDYISKPINKTKLLSLIQKYFKE